MSTRTDGFEECDGCRRRFFVHWRFPSKRGHGAWQTLCTRCHALWMEYLHQPEAKKNPFLTGPEFAPYLRGEKSLLPGMSFEVYVEDQARADVRRATDGSLGSGLGGP